MHTTLSHRLILIATILVSTAACTAQTSSPAPASPPVLAGDIASHPSWPQANPNDVKGVDALIASLYDVISGPAGKQRDWNRFRSLFLPDGRLGVIRAERPAADGQPARQGDIVFLTPDDYVTRDDPFFKRQGFFERGIANRVEEFGNLISVWSTYESRHDLADAKPFARGINSLQIVHAQGRYWVASIIWDDERPGLTLPDKYLK
jgi:hypothetical protein